jgi:hypothetical protein
MEAGLDGFFDDFIRVFIPLQPRGTNCYTHWRALLIPRQAATRKKAQENCKVMTTKRGRRRLPGKI